MRAFVRSCLSAIKLISRAVIYGIRFFGRPITVHPSSTVSWHSVLKTDGGGAIRIGPHCGIHPYAMLLTYGGDITFGAHCSVNPFSVVYGHGGTEVGNGVRIATQVVIIPANHIRGDESRPLFQAGYTARGIRIGDHVWLGAGCRILDGVEIGDHAVVGAGSVVTQSVASRATVVGNPARVLQEAQSPRRE